MITEAENNSNSSKYRDGAPIHRPRTTF